LITHLAHVPIFLRSVFFVGDCSVEEAIDAIYRLKGKRTRCEFPDGAGAVRDIKGDVYCWVKDLEKGSIVLHELTHVACSIMEVCNIPQCRDTEEVMCYLVGWLKLNVLDVVLDKRIKQKGVQQ
jgi:hypothetical protein